MYRSSRYMYRKDKKLCTNCGKDVSTCERTVCDVCAEKKSVQSTKSYNTLKNKGKCTKCGNDTDISKRVICDVCANKKLVLASKLVNTRKIKGICTKCGKVEFTYSRFLNCVTCRAVVAEYSRIKKLGRADRGVCISCGGAVDLDHDNRYCARCATHTWMPIKKLNPLEGVDWKNYLKLNITEPNNR